MTAAKMIDPATIVARCHTIEELSTVKARAEKQGLQAVVNACVAKMVEHSDVPSYITPTDPNDPLLPKFTEAVRALEAISGTAKSRTWPMLERRSATENIARLVLKTNASTGFEETIKYGIAHLSFEQIVLDHPELFDAKVLEAALQRLNSLE
ncbi:hypothetical protein [Pseudovibrio sp. Tun.PSC04-5.I4]|uniref:hypothetical protein n=1 Tax=Pseudovibrio sp. Tun.PSC04-5.I4 TaxID=1798213 RepID=UPI00088E39F7|nr:hypothetical protein [Pseudovibrio sp. Tun.PSC04-5.I4]SDR20265.1 hypothetical protein SAMN04515695_3373 [Pseudovibrio sp. Tun.PSC04-5.I4]